MKNYKLKSLPFLFFLCSIFISCDNPFEPEMCQIVVKEAENCKYELEKTEVPKNSFLKIKIIPDDRYYLKSISKRSYITSDLLKADKDTYYVLADEKITEIYIKIYRYPTYKINIDRNTKHCTISSETSACTNDRVTFTITPEKGFYFEPSDVKVREGNFDYNISESDYFECVQSKTNQNEFSFIMPEKEVTISVDMKFGIIVNPRKKEGFSIGEDIIFDIENHTPEDTYDIMYDNYYGDSWILLDSNIKLSDSYKLSYFASDEEKTGNYKLLIYPANSRTFGTSTNFDININNMPQGWTTIGIKKVSDVINSDNDISFYLSKKYSGTIIVKYYLEKKNSSDRHEGTTISNIYNNRITFYGSTIKDYKDEYDTITIWIEDQDQKIISRKITTTLYNKS